MERDDNIAVKQKSFSRIAVSNIRKLMWADAKLFRKNLPITRRLVEHIYEIRVFKNVLSRASVQNIFQNIFVLRVIDIDNEKNSRESTFAFPAIFLISRYDFICSMFW